ncbi:hypothetical protein ACGFZK_21430 [Streptomyces sp. NPDC048257]|uniref:hypothetical protein n=1 Tax=Streptomyces sp. NPDC048257 TaxID=3365526 RepID=UPI0037235AC3
MVVTVPGLPVPPVPVASPLPWVPPAAPLVMVAVAVVTSVIVPPGAIPPEGGLAGEAGAVAADGLDVRSAGDLAGRSVVDGGRSIGVRPQRPRAQ